MPGRFTRCLLPIWQAGTARLSQTGVFPAAGACSKLKRFTRLETSPVM